MTNYREFHEFDPSLDDRSEDSNARLADLAEQIYRAAYPNVDSKRFHSSKTSEIYDWLANGDLSGDPTVETLAAEWLEYDVDEESSEDEH